MTEEKVSRRGYVKYVGGIVVVAVVAAAGYGIYEATKPAPMTPTPTPTTPTPTPTPGEKVGLKFEVMGLGPDVQPSYEESIGKFQTAHPNTKIELFGIPWDTAFADTVTWIGAGKAPDAGFIGWLTFFIQMGHLEPLDDYIAKEEWDKYVESLMVGSLYKGKHYTIPVVSDIQMFYYRKDLLEKAGFTKPPDTWDELMEVSAKINDPPKTYAFATYCKGLGGAHFFAWLLWSCGGRMFDKDGNPHINSPEAIQALQSWVDWVRKYRYAPPDPISMGRDDAEGAFLAGNIAMLLTGQWFAFMIDSAKPELKGKWGVALPPKGPKERATFSTLNNFAIFAQSKHKKESGEFLEFLQRDDNLAKIAMAYQSMPPKKNFTEIDYWKKEPWPIIVEAQKYAFILIDAPEGPDYSWPAAYASGIFEGPVLEALQKAVTGTPVKEALDWAQEKALEKIAEAK